MFTYKQRVPQSHTIQPWHQIDCTKLRSWRKELQWKELILGLYSCLDLLIQSGLVSGEHEGWGRPRAVRGGGGWIRLRHVIVEPAITLSLVQGLSERSVSTNFVSTNMHYTRWYFMDQNSGKLYSMWTFLVNTTYPTLKVIATSWLFDNGGIVCMYVDK